MDPVISVLLKTHGMAPWFLRSLGSAFGSLFLLCHGACPLLLLHSGRGQEALGSVHSVSAPWLLGGL